MRRRFFKPVDPWTAAFGARDAYQAWCRDLERAERRARRRKLAAECGAWLLFAGFVVWGVCVAFRSR
jgi:hypothetical protein